MEERNWRATIASVLALLAAAVAWLVAKTRTRIVGRGVVAMSRQVLRRWGSRPGQRRRGLRRRASIPLPNLYEVHPEARAATPREIGLRSLDLDDIVGSAVGGVTQRGSDFKPLPPFRSANWEARWQRIRRALDRLAVLPPIDVVRYPPGGKYWVLDGHNRVAAALDIGQVEVDANVTELVPIGQNPSERPDNLAAALAGSEEVRAAARGRSLHAEADRERARAAADEPATADEPAEPPVPS